MEEHFKNDIHEEFEDKDEYGIRFLDNNTTIAWVEADELVLKVPMDNLINLIQSARKNDPQEGLFGEE